MSQWDKLLNRNREQFERVKKRLRPKPNYKELSNQDVALALAHYKVMDEEAQEGLDEKLASRLNADEMKIISMRFFEGKTLEFIGRQFGWDHNEAYRKIERILSKLRKDL